MKNKGRKIFLIVIAILSAVVAIAVLGQIVRERKRGYSSDRTIPLLLGYEEGAYYINEDGVPVRTEDDEWNEYLVDAGSQFYEISEVSVTFSSQYRHQVLWLDKELQVLREQEVRGGEHVFPIMDKAEYLLIPAQKDEIFSVNGRLTAAGAEEKGQKEKDAEAFSGKYLSVLGDSLSACSFYIPGNYYPHYPKGDVDIRQMWWYLLAESLDMNVCKINACASSGVTRLTWDGLTGDEAGSAGRGTDLDMLGHIPDVILVWIGGNDMAAGADKSQVAEDYRKMVMDILDTYPKAEIYLCTYYPCYLNSVDPEGFLNGEIRKIAEEFQLSIIEMEECGITLENQTEYLQDVSPETDNLGMHPNQAGFSLIADCIVRQMTEYSRQEN